MFAKIWIVRLFLICVRISSTEAISQASHLQLYASVGEFLRNWGDNDFWWKQKITGRVTSIDNSTTPQTPEPSNNNWLPNSNKVGLSYNPLVGDPVCYTGECQMRGFGLPLFKMEFTEPATGTCIKQLVPKNVSVNCIPSTEHVSTTETISDLKGLKNSQSNGVSWGVGFDIDLSGGGPLSKMTSLGFNYNEAKQTRFMIDNIFQQDSVIFYTYVKVSYVELSLYAPLLDLSVAFRHVIESMPTDNSTDTEKYITDYILNYFGTAYVSSTLLGGLAQITSIMSRSRLNPFEETSRSASKSAGLNFGRTFNFNYKTDDMSSNAQISNFTKDVDKTYATTLGGAVFAIDKEKLSDWFLTVPTNPVIVNFQIDPIFNLLTNERNRFPTDQDISKKKQLILQVLSKKLNNSKVYCENDCSSPTQGTCTATSYFQFGQCVCKPNFTGRDCSTYITPAPPAPPATPASSPSPFVG